MSRLFSVLLLSAVGMGLAAEDLSVGMKFRGVAGVKSESGVTNGLGLGVNLDLPLETIKGSRLSFELGYTYYTGDGARVPVANAPYSESNSVNYQKTNVQGFSARAAFGKTLPWVSDMGWQAGVAFAHLTSRMDAVGDYRTGSSVKTQTGSWAMSPEAAAYTVSPFVGLTYSFNTAGALELNLILASYKQVTLTPATSATVVTPVIGEKNVNTLKFEFGYLFRF